MATSVENFETYAMQLVQEATAYAANGVFDEQTDSNIRRCMVITSVLQTALMQARLPNAMTGRA